jgi:PAS domain S-box-containing protein
VTQQQLSTGGGETAGLIKAFDWSATSLGPADAWRQSLRTATALILNSAVPMVMLWGEDGIMIYNDAYSVFAGGRHPGLLGAKVREGWPEVADFNDNVMKVGLAGGTLAYKDQELTLHRHGRPEQVWMNLDYSPVPDESGKPAGVIAIVVETTERVLAERRASAEQERLRMMFEQAPGFMALLRGPEHVFELANPAYLELTGGRGVLDKPVREALPEVADQEFIELLDTVYGSGKAVVGTAVPVALARAQDGSVDQRYVDFVYQPITEMDGKVSGIFVQGSDVTGRARADDLRAAQNEMLEAAVKDATLAELLDMLVRTVEAHSQSGVLGSILLIDTDGLHLRHGAAPSLPVPYNEAIDGIPIGQGIGSCGTAAYSKKPVYVSDVSTDPLWADFRDLAREYDLRACWSTPILSSSGVLQGTFAMYYREPREPVEADLEVINLITRTASLVIERKAAEARLRELNDTLEKRVAERTSERNLLATLFETTDIMVMAADLEYNILAVNKANADEFERIYRVRPKAGDNMLALLADQPEHQAQVRAGWGRGLAGEEVTFVEAYGDESRVRPHYQISFRTLRDDAGQRIGTYQFVTDVTDRMRAEAELAEAQEALRQAQKMEAVGQLTGGIAHDFNNLLTGVIGSLDMMQRQIAKGETAKIERYASTAMTSANRAAALTHRLLAFSRRQPLDPKPVDANRLVTGMEELLRRTIGESIDLGIVTAGGLWQTLCDPHQLESAILNLAINARDAMPGGGVLTIETCNAHLDSAYAARQRDLKPGQYVCICVTDTGTGMTKDIIEKAFEPFFTTKPIGQGTGLGLSMIYGFARQSEGYARIYSEVGQGTTMKLYLPRYYGEAEGAEDEHGELTDAHRAEAGEVVLVIEDEAAVRDIVVDVLKELGYRAIEAVDGPSGLTALQSKARIDLLITDIGLPGLNGRQVVDAARQHRPNLRVLFMTGYAENAAVANGFLEPGMEMITKPFAVEALATRIRDMIEKA